MKKQYAGSYRLRSDSSACCSRSWNSCGQKIYSDKRAHGSERILRQDCGGRVRDRPGNRDYGGARSNI